MVSELCKYGSLSSAMKTNSKDFNEALKVKCLLNISSALAYLHGPPIRIIHRDLKPDNVLVVSLNPRSEICAKLSDFGISRDVSSITGYMASTAIGTPLFLAPEVVLEAKYTNSVDIYSFAIVIYVMFAGKYPSLPTITNFLAFVEYVRSGKRPDIPPTFPPDIAKMMTKCWSQKPSDRPTADVVQSFFKKYFL